MCVSIPPDHSKTTRDAAQTHHWKQRSLGQLSVVTIHQFLELLGLRTLSQLLKFIEDSNDLLFIWILSAIIYYIRNYNREIFVQ